MSILVLGHGSHGKGEFCRLLKEVHGLNSMSSSLASLPYIAPLLRCHIGGDLSEKELYRVRRCYRLIWKEAISLLNSPDKTTLTKIILNQVPVYDGMRCQEEYRHARNMFSRIFWVDASEREDPDESMGIDYEDWHMTFIDNNGSLNDLKKTVSKLVI